MHMRRSTGFALVHFKKFYVFGGFTADGKRTKKIEIYDPAHNVWELLDVSVAI